MRVKFAGLAAAALSLTMVSLPAQAGHRCHAAMEATMAAAPMLWVSML